jgi:hypothetical protein
MKWLACVAICAGAFTNASAQDFEQRGFLETRLGGFPETTRNDQSHAAGQAVFQWDLSYKIFPWLTFSGGIEAQTDSHQETERKFHLDVQDRGLLRPAFEIRSFKMTVHKGHLSADLGKQFIRWGKADILNPTDRFAPRDYLDVVDNEFLGVLAARATLEGGGNSLDLVWTPRFTPSRMPLLNERWTIPPPDLMGRMENAATHFPGGGQYGARVNHVGRRYEMSASMFEGYNHLPLISSSVYPLASLLEVEAHYPKIRMYGTDAAISFPWFTLKTEGGFFQSREPHTTAAPQSDDYFLYVAQLERQVGEWIFVGGYAGQTITQRRSLMDFDPERGLARAFLGRIGYTIDARRSASVEMAQRQSGTGTWIRLGYSQLFGAHWRTTVEVVLIGGDSTDFLGQYHRNSHVILRIRYSF